MVIATLFVAIIVWHCVATYVQLLEDSSGGQLRNRLPLHHYLPLEVELDVQGKRKKQKMSGKIKGKMVRKRWVERKRGWEMKGNNSNNKIDNYTFLSEHSCSSNCNNSCNNQKSFHLNCDWREVIQVNTLTIPNRSDFRCSCTTCYIMLYVRSHHTASHEQYIIYTHEYTQLLFTLFIHYAGYAQWVCRWCWLTRHNGKCLLSFIKTLGHIHLTEIHY